MSERRDTNQNLCVTSPCTAVVRSWNSTSSSVASGECNNTSDVLGGQSAWRSRIWARRALSQRLRIDEGRPTTRLGGRDAAQKRVRRAPHDAADGPRRRGLHRLPLRLRVAVHLGAELEEERVGCSRGRSCAPRAQGAARASVERAERRSSGGGDARGGGTAWWAHPPALPPAPGPSFSTATRSTGPRADSMHQPNAAPGRVRTFSKILHSFFVLGQLAPAAYFTDLF